jgi:hypothetical protein
MVSERESAAETKPEKAIELRPSQRLAAVFNHFADKRKLARSWKRNLIDETLRLVTSEGSSRTTEAISVALERLTGGAIRLVTDEFQSVWVCVPDASDLKGSTYLPLRLFGSRLCGKRKTTALDKPRACRPSYFSVGVVVTIKYSALFPTKSDECVSEHGDRIDYIGLATFDGAQLSKTDCSPRSSPKSSTKACLWLGLPTNAGDNDAIPVALGDVVLFAGACSVSARQEHAGPGHKRRYRYQRYEPLVYRPFLCVLGKCCDAVPCPGLVSRVDQKEAKAMPLCEGVFDRRDVSKISGATRCQACARTLLEASSRTRRPELNHGIVPRSSVFPSLRSRGLLRNP